MNILAFDTAGSFLSTGLLAGGKFFEENREAGLKHSEYLLPAVNRLMKTAQLDFSDLDLIVCSRGPGSFTGLRIGMSTAKGLSTGSGTPVISVNNLDAYAYGLGFFDGTVVPVIDARKKRYYTAFYRNGSVESEYLDISAEEILSASKKYDRILFTGPGVDLLKEDIGDNPNVFHFYKNSGGFASTMIALGQNKFAADGPDPDNTGPMYIRLSDAELTRK